MFQSITLFGNTLKLYDVFNNMATIAELVLMFMLIKDYKKLSSMPAIANKYYDKKGRKSKAYESRFYILEMLCTGAVITVFANITATPLSQIFLGSSDANFFPNVLITPLVIIALAFIFKLSMLKMTDFTAHFTSIALIFFKIACFCDGCCNGIEYDRGLYNHVTERYEVPVQLIELACAVLIFITLFVMRKKCSNPGLRFPVFMIMYSGLRFCSEFLRDDYPAVVGRMTGYHILCLIGLVLGIAFLVVVLKYGDKITAYFESRNQAFYDKKINAYNAKRMSARKRKKK